MKMLKSLLFVLYRSFDVIIMLRDEFISLIGEDIIVFYPFGDEVQEWNMKYFSIDDSGNISHSFIDSLIMDVFIPKCYLAVDEQKLLNELFEFNLVCQECDFNHDIDKCNSCVYLRKLAHIRSLLESSKDTK